MSGGSINNASIADEAQASKLIECPVCLEPITSKIFQCCNGHLICEFCIKDLKKCGVCREEFPAKLIRNLALESFTENLQFKCRNASLGCEFQSSRKNLRDHVFDCFFG